MVYQAIHTPMQPLTGPSGEVTTGPYTFTKALLRLARVEEPTHLVAALDTDRSSLFRRKIYPDYKKGREKPCETKEEQEEDLSRKQQVGRCLEILRTLQVPRFEISNYEADDVIASIAKWAVLEHDMDVLVVSRDKDLHQIVSDRVYMLDPITAKVTTPDEVAERWGVGPELVPGMQALMGDPTDSIPGVKGIGKKYAAQLIAGAGSLDAAVERCMADNKWPKPSVAKALIAASQDGTLETMRQLVTLRTDLEFAASLDALKFRGFNFETARPIFRALGFRRWSEW